MLDGYSGYSPGDGFRQVELLAPLVEEAASSNTELWLVQLPVNEVSPTVSVSLLAFVSWTCGFFSLWEGYRVTDYGLFVYARAVILSMCK